MRTAAHRRFDLVTSIPVSFVELAAYEVAELCVRVTHSFTARAQEPTQPPSL